jgi:hypothetical protein
MNGTSFTTGKIGTSSFNFDGVNDYIQLPSNSLNFTGDFSISLWVNLGSVSFQNLMIIDSTGFGNNSSPAEGTSGWSLFYTGGFVYFSNYNDNNLVQTWTNQLTTANVWHHIVITSTAGSMKLYLNTDNFGNTTTQQRPNYRKTVSTRIGVSRNNNMYFLGKMDGITTWNKVLSQNEVTQLYNLGNGTQYPFSSKLLPSPNDAVSTNNGTTNGGLTYTAGKVGNAFNFNGTNAYVGLPNNSFNSVLTGNFTVSLWVYLTSVGGSQTITCNMSSPSANYWNGWELRMVGSVPIFKMWNNTGTALDLAGSSLSINTWYNIVLTRKYGSGSKIYVNSALSNSNTNTSNPSVSGTFYPSIGALRSDGVNKYNYLSNGSKVDTLNVWTKELSQDEITQLYNLGTGTQYPFSGQTLPSANNQFAIDNGTLMNGCTFTDGKIGKAFTFDGVNDYVQLPNNSLNFTGDFAISVWIYPTSGNTQCLLDNLALGASPLYKGWQFDINNISGAQSGKITFTIPQTYTTYTGWQFNTTALTLNSWNHVVIQRVSGVNTYCWVNGVSQTYTLYGTGADITKDPIYDTTQIVTLGSFKKLDTSIGNLLKAGTKIDGLSVWQKVLTQAEITELYNSGAGKQLTVATPIVTNGLVLNLDASRLSSYPNAGTTWTDISGNGNNGTLVNGPIFGTANGGVINFDGVNDYVDLGTKSSLAPGTSDFTISFWINPNNWGSLSSTSYSPIFVTLVTNGLWIGKSGANFILRGAYIANDIEYSVLPTENQWTMVTVNRVGNTGKIYYNGSVVASATVTRNYVSGNSYLANDIPSNGNFSNIKLSTFSYYNRGLSELEITQNYNATKSRFGL